MGRAPCCSKVGLNRGPWTPEEDSLLSKYIEAHGEGNWRALPKAAGLLRCGKSCRLRWVNYLRPNVKRGNITEDEEDLIIMLHALLGNRWSLIAARMPGRTDNEIKNYWNTHLSKKLANKGLDPKTHKPVKNASTNSPKKEPLAAGAPAAAGAAAAAAPSSSSSSCEEKQEAWETTMDLDTSSYSTGTHFLDESTDVPANTTEYKYNKRKSLVPSPQAAAAAAEVPPAKVTKIQPVLNHLKIYKQSSFSSCASPSSVLQFSSPTASCSDSQSQQTTNSNSSSSCLTSKSSQREVHRNDGKQQEQPVQVQLNSLFEGEPSSAAEASDVAMLQFADFEEFLCTPKGGPSSVAEEFGSGTEFWESLARIEPETSDLWGVFEEGGVTTPPGVSSLLRSNCCSPAAAAVQNSSSLSGFQENISELLFC